MGAERRRLGQLTDTAGEKIMLYRVLIGMIPTVLIALFMTGAIPVGSVLPTQEYRSSAVRAAVGKDGK